jgi:hypothetical protein
VAINNEYIFLTNMPARVASIAICSDKMPLNLIQQLKLTQDHIHMLRTDPNATCVDILDDMETHMVNILHCIVTTPTVHNFVLPIDSFDNNDVFLKKEHAIASEV